MSLLIWLPLDGNFNNQGLSGQLNFTTTGTVSDADGKIGQSKAFSSSNIIAPYNFTLGNEASMCLWVYYTAFPSTSSNDWLCELASTSGYTNAVLGLSTYHKTYLAVMAGGKSDSTYTHGFSLNTWYHIAIVKKSATVYLYINGQLKKTYTNLSGGTVTSSDKISLASNVVNSSTKLKGRLNDVRIYDHALSAKEIEEIFKGLILHYKLDFSNNNMLKDRYRTYNSSQYLAYQLNLVENLQANQTYTMQLWDVNVSHTGKTASQLGFGVYWGGGNVQLKTLLGTSYFTNGHADYLKFTFTPTTNQANHSNASNLWLNIYNSPASATGTKNMRIGAWKLEKGSIPTPWKSSNDTTIIYDSSGYFNDGIISGSLVAASGGPRYSVATSFSGSQIIEADPLPTSAKTISAWIKWSTVPTGTGASTYVVPIHDKVSGMAIGICNGGQYLITYVGESAGGTGSEISCSIQANQWYHIVVVKTGDTTRNVYINGTQATPTSSSYWGGDLDKFIIGGRHAADVYKDYLNGQISDVRVYATALTESQVKELYNTSASIDSYGNVYARELVES